MMEKEAMLTVDLSFSSLAGKTLPVITLFQFYTYSRETIHVPSDYQKKKNEQVFQTLHDYNLT